MPYNFSSLFLSFHFCLFQQVFCYSIQRKRIISLLRFSLPVRKHKTIIVLFCRIWEIVMAWRTGNLFKVKVQGFLLKNVFSVSKFESNIWRQKNSVIFFSEYNFKTGLLSFNFFIKYQLSFCSKSSFRKLLSSYLHYSNIQHIIWKQKKKKKILAE